MKKISKDLLIILLLFLFVVQSAFILILVFNDKGETYNSSFLLLNPSIAEIESQKFKEIQDSYFVNLFPLKSRIQIYLDNIEEKNISVYVEHLNTGAWIGIDEKEKFEWGSLNKLPVAICILKEIEETNLTLNYEVEIIDSDLDDSFGDLYIDSLGNFFPIKQLLNYSLIDSDNTAYNALNRFCPIESFKNSIFGSGVKSFDLKQGDSNLISPKMYSSFFRILYNSGYLKRSNSNYLLSLLSNSNFNFGIPRGVAQDVTVSHKIAFKQSLEQYHDCGIVYFEDEPYLICVMTKNLSYDYSNIVISRISNIVYEFMNFSKKE